MKKKKENKLEELERRLRVLEETGKIIQILPYIQPTYPPSNTQQQCHYHGSIPCYNNPCYWA